MSQSTDKKISGDRLLDMLAALANPHRLRIIAALDREPVHVSQLARDMGMGRPLLYMHLKRLEGAGLVEGKLELSPDGKALRIFSLSSWAFSLSPKIIANAVKTLSPAIDRES